MPLLEDINWHLLGRQSTIVFALVLGGVLIAVLTRILYTLHGHPLSVHPGPLLWRISRLPADYHMFIGNLNRQRVKLHQQYGPIVRIGPNELSFADSRAWKDVMEHRPEFPKHRTHAQFSRTGLNSILTAEKDDHARFRRILAHAFSERGLREQEGRIQHFVDLLIERLRERSTGRERTDMVEWYTIAVFDVIGDLAWGESFNGLRDRRVHEWIPAIIGNLKYMVQDNICKRRGLSRFQSMIISRETTALRARNLGLVREKCDQRAKLEGAQGDFWDRVLIKSSNDNEGGEGMSKAEMYINASVLILAGAETSATTLSGATYLLLRHPEKMQRLLSEVRMTFKSSSEIDVLSVNRLTYMLAVLHETLRLYPPVPNPMVRVPPQGGGTVCGHWLPEDTVINVHLLSMNRNSFNFHRALDFVPERWLDDAPAEFANDNKAAHQPFSAGIRNCIGRNLAFAETRLILAKVLYNFDLELYDHQQTGDWLDQKSWGVWSKDPLYVGLSPAK